MEELLREILQELRNINTTLKGNHEHYNQCREDAEKSKIRIMAALKDMNPQMASICEKFMQIQGGK